MIFSADEEILKTGPSSGEVAESLLVVNASLLAAEVACAACLSTRSPLSWRNAKSALHSFMISVVCFVVFDGSSEIANAFRKTFVGLPDEFVRVLTKELLLLAPSRYFSRRMACLLCVLPLFRETLVTVFRMFSIGTAVATPV